MGEVTQIRSGGTLEATPHCVTRSPEIAGKGISRSTFVVFMDPDPLDRMEVPRGMNPLAMIQNSTNMSVPQITARWENGITYKEFLRKTFEYYT